MNTIKHKPGDLGHDFVYAAGELHGFCSRCGLGTRDDRALQYCKPEGERDAARAAIATVEQE